MADIVSIEIEHEKIPSFDYIKITFNNNRTIGVRLIDKAPSVVKVALLDLVSMIESEQHKRNI